MEFTRAISKEIGTSIEVEIQKFLDINYPGVTATYRGGNYKSRTFDMKLELSTVVDGDTQAEADYKKYANLYGLPLEMLGARFNFNGTMFTVKGFKPKARKNDILLSNDRGLEYVAQHEGVIMAYKMHMSRDLGNLMPQEVA